MNRRLPVVLRRLAWAALPLWTLSIIFLWPSISHGKRMPESVPQTFAWGLICLAAGLGFWLTDRYERDPEGTRLIITAGLIVIGALGFVARYRRTSRD